MANPLQSHSVGDFQNPQSALISADRGGSPHRGLWCTRSIGRHSNGDGCASQIQGLAEGSN